VVTPLSRAGEKPGLRAAASPIGPALRSDQRPWRRWDARHSSLRSRSTTTPPGNRCPRRINHHDHAPSAAVGAHRTAAPIRQCDRRIGHAASARLDDLDRLAGEAGERPRRLDPVGERPIGEIGVKTNGDFRHDRLPIHKTVAHGCAPFRESDQEVADDQVMAGINHGRALRSTRKRELRAHSAIRNSKISAGGNDRAPAGISDAFGKVRRRARILLSRKTW
jgi:hypothetical protein